MDTLVLSPGYQPMAQINWQRAISMWVTGRVEIVEEYDDRFIATVNKVFKMPAVIRFIGVVARRYHKKRSPKFTRSNVFLRDHGRCQYCSESLNKDTFTLDHVLPVSKGGTKSWDNIVSSCPQCNQRKRNRTPSEAGMKLLKQPFIPNVLPAFYDVCRFPKKWKDYIPIPNKIR
jgi:5-methylcytosine-specific restriction endonuclease McrA